MRRGHHHQAERYKPNYITHTTSNNNDSQPQAPTCWTARPSINGIALVVLQIKLGFFAFRIPTTTSSVKMPLLDDLVLILIYVKEPYRKCS